MRALSASSSLWLTPAYDPLFNTVKKTLFLGHPILLIRDDSRYHPDIPMLNGNKLRKFQYLLQSSSSSISANVNVVVSRGGMQSNSMAALSEICRKREMEFVYLTKDRAAESYDEMRRSMEPLNNYNRALSNGMKLLHVTADNYASLDILDDCGSDEDNRCSNGGDVELLCRILPEYAGHPLLYVPTGGACRLAEEGVTSLADDIASAIANHGASRYKSWKVIVASGTGTTALFLARALSLKYAGIDVEVVCAPCVGNELYLRGQMERLDRASGSAGIFPNILHTQGSPRRTFAKPCAEHLQIWHALKSETGLDSFDLIYAPRAIELLRSESYVSPPIPHSRDVGSEDAATTIVTSPSTFGSPKCLLSDPQFENTGIIYYHCGGAEGNLSQLQRYSRKNDKKK